MATYRIVDMYRKSKAKESILKVNKNRRVTILYE